MLLPDLENVAGFSPHEHISLRANSQFLLVIAHPAEFATVVKTRKRGVWVFFSFFFS